MQVVLLEQAKMFTMFRFSVLFSPSLSHNWCIENCLNWSPPNGSSQWERHHRIFARPQHNLVVSRQHVFQRLSVGSWRPYACCFLCFMATMTVCPGSSISRAPSYSWIIAERDVNQHTKHNDNNNKYDGYIRSQLIIRFSSKIYINVMWKYRQFYT